MKLDKYIHIGDFDKTIDVNSPIYEWSSTKTQQKTLTTLFVTVGGEPG
jgi:hypothetical protein